MREICALCMALLLLMYAYAGDSIKKNDSEGMVLHIPPRTSFNLQVFAGNQSGLSITQPMLDTRQQENNDTIKNHGKRLLALVASKAMKRCSVCAWSCFSCLPWPFSLLTKNHCCYNAGD